MGRLVPTYHDDGKHNYNSFVVTIREVDHFGTNDVISPTQIIGTGSSYGDALHDFVRNLDEYISKITQFRDEVLKTSRAYTEAVEVNYAGRHVNRVSAPKKTDGPQFFMD